MERGARGILWVALALAGLAGCDQTSPPDREEASTGLETGAAGGPSGPIIVQPGDPPGNFECSTWEQDCPPETKCMPFANDGGLVWNATRCAPLAGAPKAVGDRCTVQSIAVSGDDDCERGAMCWHVDPATNEGTCVSLCEGSPSEPGCPETGTTCSLSNKGVLALCLPVCNPVVQDCGDDEACYPIQGSFVCAPDASGSQLGLYGDPCSFINTCDPGFGCFTNEGIPGCNDSIGCCTPFCDLQDSAEDVCPGAAEGQRCLPLYDEGDAPPGLETLGYCFIPQ